MQLADPRQPGDEGRGRIAADAARLREQRIGLAGDRRDDRDDLLTVANMAIHFLRAGPVVVLAFEHRAAEFEDAEFTFALVEILSVHGRRASSAFWAASFGQ